MNVRFAALVSAAVCVLAWPDVVFGGRTFLPVARVPMAYPERPDQRSALGRAEFDPGAVAWEVLPWAHVEHRALLHHELPLWDRSNGIGHPLLGSGQTALFYPLHWIVLLDPSKPWLWDAMWLLLRFFVAFGSVLLLLELGAPRWIAALGAPIGALNGVFILFSIRADLQAYACMPWILLALLKLRKGPGPLRAVALALAIALCLFGAHPEPSFVTLTTSALAGAALLARVEPRRIAYLGWACAAALTAALLSAPFWLPLFDLIPHSWSLHAVGAGGVTHRPLAVALEWLMPTVYEHGNLRTVFGGGETPWGWLGPTCSVLAVAAVLGALRTRALFWVWPTLFLALAIFGAPGTLWLGKLPLFSRMPVAIYFQFPVLFLLSISGAFALSKLSKAEIGAAALAVVVVLVTASLWAPVDKPLLKLGYAAAVALVFGLLALRPRLAFLLPIACMADLAAFRCPLSPRADPLAGGPYVSWLQERARKDPPFRVMGLWQAFFPNSSAAFGLEDVRMCEGLFPDRVAAALNAAVQPKPEWNWFTTATPEDGFDAQSPLLDAMNVRYFVSDGTPPMRIQSPLLRAFLDAHAAVPWMDHDGRASIRTVGLASAKVAVPPQRPVLAGRAVRARLKPLTKWEMRAGERAIASGGEGAVRVDLSAFAGREVSLALQTDAETGWLDLHWESAQGDRDPPEIALGDTRIVFRDPFLPVMAILERPHPWPRAVAFANVEAFADPLARTRSLSPYLAVVESDFPSGFPRSVEPLRAQISPPRYAQNRVSFDADVSRDAVVVLADAWSEGWRATIDGAPVNVFHANYAFRGVLVPKGRHAIEMRYAPRAWTLAWILALAGLALCALQVASAASRRRLPSES